jgi:hypothetical protein
MNGVQKRKERKEEKREEEKRRKERERRGDSQEGDAGWTVNLNFKNSYKSQTKELEIK